MNVLILGANGFIGSHLTEAILQRTDWSLQAMDLYDHHLKAHFNHPRFAFKRGDMTKEQEWLETAIAAADVVLPLAAIANPALYVKDPLRIFELDFEANLAVIRLCVKQHKYLVFPSTSEVYGMSPDQTFDEEESVLVTGPIHKERWIYATSKQLLDRVIYAYGKHEGLRYCLFRPFNWYGPRLDDIHNPKAGGSRVLTQFLGNIMRGEPLQLVDGGEQKRCFTYIEDGIDALLRIIANKDDCATSGIFNIGNPSENISIRQLAELLLCQIKTDYSAKLSQVQVMDVDGKDYYGEGYQDVSLRVPSIKKAAEKLGWEPKINFETGLQRMLAYYLQ